jgi:hypothetical protein
MLPISSEQYAGIDRATIVLREALYLEQKYEFVVENYIEFEETLLRSGVADMVLGNQDYRWFSTNRAGFDRRIMNLLTTAKTYSDSVEQHLNKIYERDQERVTPALAAFSSEYDARLGYRTMCKLRNFVQHQGFPVHGSFYHSKWLEEGEVRKARNRNTVDPYLLPAELRKGDFNRTVLEELEATSERVDLKFLVRDYMEGLSIGHCFVREQLKEKIEQSNGVLDAARKSYRDRFESETSNVGLAAVSDEPDSPGVETVSLHLDPEEYRSYLAQKNGKLTNLTRRYVSSEVVKD